MSAFFTEILNYSLPHPFVLPGEVVQDGTKQKVGIIPFDGRYLEEIMYNLNLARVTMWDKPMLEMKSYDPKGNIVDTFYPNPIVSQLNDKISIIAFANIVEDIKAAIEDTIEEPDSLKSHFGRCFNQAHYKGFPFISQALIQEIPSLEQQLKDQNMPFFSFPENLDGATMHGFFHKFNYYLPSTSNSSRTLLVDAFRTARQRLTDGIPMFTRMQNGEWPITKDELITVLGMSIYSIHSNINKRPEKNPNWTMHSDKYSITDHRRVFYTFCSFVIQMLRYQVPKMERFTDRHGEIWGSWWITRWILLRQNCYSFWARQNTSKMLDFPSGRWHFCGHGEFEGEGALMNIPQPGIATSINWFAGGAIIDQQFAPAMPYRMLPAQWFAHTEYQDPEYAHFFTFHKFMNFELQTEEDIEGYTSYKDRGLMTRITIGADAEIYARLGGFVNSLSPWENEPDVVVLFGGPITEINLYDKFVENNSQNKHLDELHTAITSISIALQDWTNTTQSCDFSGREQDGITTTIKYVGVLDDMVHDPVEFLPGH